MGNCFRWRLYLGKGNVQKLCMNARTAAHRTAKMHSRSGAQNPLDIHIAREQAAWLPFEHVAPIVRVGAVMEANTICATSAAPTEICRPSAAMAKDVQPQLGKNKYDRMSGANSEEHSPGRPLSCPLWI